MGYEMQVNAYDNLGKQQSDSYQHTNTSREFLLPVWILWSSGESAFAR
jgi:hypothetical protein